MSQWRFGAAEVDITPGTPQYMTGMGWRTEKSKGVYLPLKVQALFMSDGRAQAILLAGDVILFPRDMVGRLRRYAETALGIPGDHAVFTASHSHDTPRLCDDIALPGSTDPAYVAEFEDKVRGVMHAAVAEARPGAMTFSRVRSTVGVNRRQWNPATGVAQHGPNPEGAHDKAVDTRWIHDARRYLLATVTAYGCHATSCGQYELGGDYPGFFRRSMEKKTRAAALWCAGCGGNVRPWFTGKLDAFGGGSPEAARAMGEAHARDVLRGRVRTLPVALDRLRVSNTIIRLPLQKAWSYREFVERGFGSYVKTFGEKLVRDAYEVARKRTSVPFEIQVLSLRPDHHLVFWSGEVCTDIGIALKDLCPGEIVTPHAYANGAVGYIPARHLYPQGGYEPERSCCFFRLPAPFQPDIEDRILKATLRLIAQHRAS